MREERIHGLKEGKGAIKLFHLLEKEGLWGDFELYCVLDGEGIVNDNKGRAISVPAFISLMTRLSG